MLIKHVGPLAAHCSNAGPMIIDNLLRTSPEMSQKWSYKINCFTFYVLLDANMLQMLKK